MSRPIPPVKSPPRRRLLARLSQDARGATAVEYGLILAMIVLVMIVGLSQVASVTIGMWGNVNSKVSAATGR